jgi:Tol biopolymer transport system component
MGFKQTAAVAGCLSLSFAWVGGGRAQSRPALPPNIEVAPEFRLFVDAMWESSPTFRRQIGRIAAAPRLRLRLDSEIVARSDPSKARASFQRQGGVLIGAELYFKRSLRLPELIAHEVEHVIEQLDGVDLEAHAGGGAAWKSADASFETVRAIEAGQRVASELTAKGNTTSLPVRTPPSTSRVTRARLHDDNSAPMSPASARISADGRHVVVVSSARLVPQDANERLDVYVLDVVTGETTLETPGADGDSYTADISADGRFVVFASAASSLTQPTFPSGPSQIFLRDRGTQTTSLVTTSASGKPANGPSYNPVISDDGVTIAFESSATDLVEPTADGFRGPGVYVMRSSARFRMRVEMRGGISMSPSLSADGRLLVFASRGVPDCGRTYTCDEAQPDTNGLTDIYVLNTDTNVVKRISQRPDGRCFDGPSYQPVVSGNGRYVAFVSEASNVGGQTARRMPQVYVHDLATNGIELVSRTPSARAGNASSIRPAISFDGTRVGFQSLASNLICERDCRRSQRDVNLLWDVFVYDRTQRRMIRVSSDPSGEWMATSRAPSLDGRGELIAFASRYPIDNDDVAGDEDLFVCVVEERPSAT